MSSLFRPEVIENRQSQWLGSIQLLRPVSLHVLTLLAVGAAVIVAAYLWFGEYTRKAHVKGFLAPDRGVLRLMSPQAATVLESHAVEGKAVHAGEVLYVLSVDAATWKIAVGTGLGALLNLAYRWAESVTKEA